MRHHGGWSMLLAVLVVVGLVGDVAAQSNPEGQLIIAFDTSIAATYFDPAETAGVQTPFVFLYALHDALVKPLPGNDMAPCLAESWTESPDGLVYEFKLREGLIFHNGDPFTAEDVQFSFLRYKGTSAKLLHERVQTVEVIDAHRIRFVLQAPWPDFLTFYATLATGAAWVVPKKYLEQVGDDGFKQHPVGLGPYRFVRSDPGVELVLEANERYWRKVPAINRIIFKGVPESPTRLAMLKTREADVAYLMYREEAHAIQTDPALRLVRSMPPVTWYVDFPEQWDPKSPWHDKRVRLAVNYAIDKQVINEVERQGLGRLTGSIIPRGLEFALPLEPYPYDPAQAKRLLAEAGHPNGFEAGDLTPLPPFVTMGEAVANDLAAVGIRARVRTMERAAFLSTYREKKLRGLILNVTAALGNAATRIETFVLSTGTYAYGGYPDLDDLFRQQAVERDRGKREARLHQIQRLMQERVMHAPIFDSVPLHGVGPRVEEPAVGLNPLLYFTAPYEEMRLKQP
ncbi:MAG: ABC transporter substrate-binding protein [Candidatus Entotheonellia bacterium]